jgi:sugar lactone lactonase YvrE
MRADKYRVCRLFFQSIFWAIFLMLSGIPVTGFSSYSYYFPDALIGQSDCFHDNPNRVDGKGLYYPAGIAIDTNITPNHLYIADTSNNRILVWGNIDDAFLGKEADLVLGQPNLWSVEANYGGVSAVSLSDPVGLFVAPNGNLHVCDSGNHRALIFKPPFADDNVPDGLLGQYSFDANYPNAGASISNVGFDYPMAVVVDNALNVYVADTFNNRALYFMDPLGSSSDILADKVLGHSNFNSGLPNGGSPNPSATSLYQPMGLALDLSGNLWISDTYNYRLIRHDQTILQFLNQAMILQAQPIMSTSYSNWDGVNPWSNASPYPFGIDNPWGIAVDSYGQLYVADYYNNRVLRWNSPSSSGTSANFVFGQYGDFFNNDPHTGAPSAGTLYSPLAIAFDSQKRLYIVDMNNSRVLRYSNPATSYNADGLCGQPDFSKVQPNLIDGTGLNGPNDIALDTRFSPPRLYIADKDNNRILGWESLMEALLGAPADLILGQPDAYSSDPGCSQSALNGPSSVAVDEYSNVWISDSNNNRVIGFQNPYVYDKVADVLLGQIGWGANNPNKGNTSPSSDTLSSPDGLLFDNIGRLWVADEMNHRALGFSNPYFAPFEADTVIGQPDMTTGYSNYPALGPNSLNYPTDVAMDSHANLLICDSGNNRILGFFPPYTTADLVFGQFDNFYTMDADVGATVSAYGLNYPAHIAFSKDDTLFVSDVLNSRVLGYFMAATNTGDTVADLVFGQEGCMSCGGLRTGESPKPTNLNFPMGLMMDASNNLYVADEGYNRVLVFHVPQPPVLKAAIYVDFDKNSLINADDRLILHFSQALKFGSVTGLIDTDFNLPHSGDSLGDGFDTVINPIKRSSLVVKLGNTPSLVIGGSGSSSSAIGITPDSTAKILSLYTDLGAIPTLPVDIKYIMKTPTPRQFGPLGGTLQIPEDPDALFTKHKLYLPPGAVSSIYKDLYWFSMEIPDIELSYLSSIKIQAVSEAYVTLEYLADGVDLEGGYLEKYIRIARLAEVSPGVWVPDWQAASFSLDLENHTITALLGDLYSGSGGHKSGKVTVPSWGIGGDIIISDARKLVDENSMNVDEDSGGGGKTPLMRSAPVCLSPGPDCIYINHELCIPGYLEVSSGGYNLTIRQAVASEREGFPDQSGAIFVLESDPEFPSDVPFDLTIQYVPNPDPDLTDVVTLDGQPGSEGKLRMARKNPSTGEFEFVPVYDSVSFNGNHTVTTSGVTNLTSGGVGVYGIAVNNSAESLILCASNWQLYE